MKFPATESVLAAPTVRFPLLVKLPAVVKFAPPVSEKLPLLEPSPAMPAMFAHAAAKGEIPGVGGDVGAGGELQAGAVLAFQVPAVNVLPESWSVPRVAASAIVPESASMVPVFVIEPKTLKLDVPVLAVLRMIPALSREVCPARSPSQRSR